MNRQPAGDFDYERHGSGYASQRRPDPRIASLIHAALGTARTVLNVGAGSGSYEPDDRYVLAVEPSAAMRAQRPPNCAPVIEAVAEHLPLDDQSFDASTALDRYWLSEYAPEMIAAERRRYPAIEDIRRWLGDRTTVESVPIPADCTDGFTEAFYSRPERLLDPRVRGSQSAWGFVDDDAKARFVRKLDDDLNSGEWRRKHGHCLTQPTFDGSLRLIVRRPP